MANKRVATIVIKSDGTEVRETTKDIERLSNGLQDLDVRQAREAQETLKALGNSDLSSTIQQVREIKRAADNIDSTQVKEAQKAIKEVGSEAQNAAGVYQDASGRMRDANGRFIKSASDVKDAADKMGDSVSDAAKQFDKLKNAGATIQNFGGKIQGLGKTMTLGVTAPIVGLNILGLKFNSLEEDSKTTFKVFLKDGEKANQLFKELSDFADKTPYQLDEVLAGGTTLLQAKLDDLKGVLKDAGDLAAANKTKGATIQDTSNVFARLKAGDFGEAFERLRDFGISRELLEGEGLKFDKQGSYKGSVDDAIKAVRAIIQRDMGGLMDELSGNFSGQLSTLLDTANRFLGELTKPLFNELKAGLNEALPVIVGLKNSFAELSPEIKNTVLVVLGFVAAIAPILVVVGTIITAIGGFVGAIGTIGTALAGLTATGTVMAGLGAVVSTALGTVLPIILAVVAAVGVFAAAAYLAYESWSSNFGNIQGTVSVFSSQVSEAFNGLLSVIQPAIDAVKEYALSGFMQITAWWATNGKEISQAAEQVFAAILRVVQSGLDAVKSFWQENGDWITEYTKIIWEAVKGAISGAMTVISGIIKTVTGVINGDWSRVWTGLKEIVGGALQAVVSVIGAGGALLAASARGALNGIFALAGWVMSETYKIGQAVVQGIVNGIASGVGSIASAAWDLGKRAINSLKEAVDSHSPSREAHKVGEFVGDGLADGITARTTKVKTAAKKLGDETIKALRESVKEFNKIAGLSPDQVRRKIQADEYSQGKSDLETIIKLRGQTGLNSDQPLPTTFAGIAAELKTLNYETEKWQKLQKQTEDAIGVMEELFEELPKKRKEYAAEEAKILADRKTAIEQAGAADVLNLQKSIELLGVTDDFERQRIENHYELLKLRQDLMNDGFAPYQIEEIIAIARAQSAANLELTRLRELKETSVRAAGAQKSLDDQLATAQRGGRELTVYEKTQRDILENYKNLSVAEQRKMLDTATQIDVQKQANEAYEQTREIVGDLVGIMTESGVSLRDKFTNVFSYIADRFKQMLLKMATDWAMSKIFGGGTSGGNSAASSGSGIFDTIKNIFGGGSSISKTTPPFVGKSSAFDANNPFASVLSGSSSSSSGSGSSYTQMKSLFSGGSLASLASAALPAAGIALFMNSLKAKTPVSGLLQGGLVGLVAGFINQSKIRREQETIRDGLMVDALKQLNDLKAQITDTRNKNINAQGIVDSAKTVQTNYYAQVNASITEKKTKGIAIKDGRERIDPLVQQIIDASAGAKLRQEIRDAAAARDAQILPEFANGVYMDSGFKNQYSDFKRYNGMMPGSYTGRDYIPALIGDGEMILNARQIAAVRARAGADVFAGLVPNYAPQPQNNQLPKFSTGANFNTSGFASSPAASGDTYIFQVDATGSNLTAEDIEAAIMKVADSTAFKTKIGKTVEDKYSRDKLRFKRKN